MNEQERREELKIRIAILQEIENQARTTRVRIIHDLNPKLIKLAIDRLQKAIADWDNAVDNYRTKLLEETIVLIIKESENGKERGD